ncbi:MAG: M23 family metallopeptidase [Clostridia bacterium]|nr:M23 family metallopeptidase [Clostridia bacterium]
MKLEPAVNWIEREVNRELTLDVAYEQVKNEVAKIYDKLTNLVGHEAVIPTSTQEINHEENVDLSSVTNEDTEPILSIHTDVSTEPVYEEAVEGVNQMSEDAHFIKENYQLIYPIQGTVTSRFGVRVSDNPIVTAYHSGIDLAADTGTKIGAALSGKVITATTSEAYGKYIMIQTDDVVTLYAHCSKLNVKEGQEVKQGAIIGEVGSTGWATGPHLHFEIRLNGRLVNPADILDFGE